MKKLLFALMFMVGLGLISPKTAEAACSGSGITWSCTANSTKANVNTAMGSATTGATITMAAGTYSSWTSGALTPSPAKSVAIICETVGGCDAALGSSNLLYHDDVNGATSKSGQVTWRLSGFDFTGACASPCNWIYPRTGQATQYLTLVVDHNTWVNATEGSDFFTFGEGSRPMVFKGVFHHNTWTNAVQLRMVVYGAGDPESWAGSLLGQDNPESGNCLFFEDNTITFTSPSNAGLGFIDGENTACYVIRNNTLTNARTLQHGVTHGWGTSNFEIYRNSYIRTNNSDGNGSCYRSIHMQGSGTGAFWGNTFSCFSSISENAIDILHYRDTTPEDAVGSGTFTDGTERCDGNDAIDGNTSPIGTYHGYPCYHQPGRAPGGNDLFPIPIFLNVNSANSAKVDATYSCPWVGGNMCAFHVLSDRDFYNAVSATAQSSSSSPFNGTTGIGHGTLARRPSTCTHTTAPDGDNGGGVMYWATDVGAWDRTTAGTDGVLYRCSATNTWTQYYVPYPYPHPLQGDAGIPDSPSNPRIAMLFLNFMTGFGTTGLVVALYYKINSL